MEDVAVIDDPAVAEVSLDPLRARPLAALERVGLVELVEEHRKGNMTERIVQATAAAYVISPPNSTAQSRTWSRSTTATVRAFGRIGSSSDCTRGSPGPRPTSNVHQPPPTRTTEEGRTMSKDFVIRREIELPADPDRVWEAIATSDGLAAWQFPSMFGDIQPIANVWEPPNHLVLRVEKGEWFNSLEYVVEAASGGRSVLRYVHSGVFVDDWDAQFDGASQHTDFYLHTLGQYLEFFDGRPVIFIGEDHAGIHGPEASIRPDGFERLKQALGLPADVTVGEEVVLEPEGTDRIVGVVDYLQHHFVGIRTASALYQFFGRNVFGAPVAMSVHEFGPVDDAAAVTARWKAWLDTSLA